MKYILFIAFSMLITFNLNAQIVFKSGENVTSADLRVRVSENVILADIRVRIGENVTFADFTVGITNQKSKADFIVTEGYNYDLRIRAGEKVILADIRIRAGESVILSDVRVKIKTSGTVDYLVYVDKDIITMNDIVIAILPALNKEMDYEFEDVPKIQ